MYSNKLLCKHRVEYDDDNTDDAEDDNNIAFGQWVSFWDKDIPVYTWVLFVGKV